MTDSSKQDKPTSSPTNLATAGDVVNERIPHRASALGFGLAFLVLGLCGLLQTANVAVDTATLSAIVLLGLGAAGLWSVLQRR
ncbi:MAG: hypothetical protein OXU20_14670 [Myxococcales bacterium]|nr:hypothetical protein [Myxococcales bacterium]MDD9969144.1 hypothetical protein [Myxococcales bacterium]